MDSLPRERNPAIRFFIGVVALTFYGISKKLNLEIQDNLAERRKTCCRNSDPEHRIIDVAPRGACRVGHGVRRTTVVTGAERVKVRRSSTDPTDLFHAHIGGMDAFARGLLVAQRIIDDKVLSTFVAERYGSFTDGIGARIMSGKTGFAEIERWVRSQPHPVLQSGRQEMLENLINSYL